MHGELLRTRCTTCRGTFADAEDITVADPCPLCAARGGLRPDVVWFGETPMRLAAIEAALAAADLFVAIGTSGTVYPAAGYVRAAARLGIPTCEINLEPSGGADLFDEARYGPAGETVPAYFREIGL